MKGIGRVVVLAMVVGVALAASSAYADQPADRSGKSTTISTDGAVWGGGGHWGAPPADSIIVTTHGHGQQARQAEPQGNSWGRIREFLNRLLFLPDGAVWGFSPPVR